MRKIIILGIILLLYPYLAWAQEFRTLNPVSTPLRPPKGAIPVENIQPVSHGTVENAVREIFSTWNKGSLEKYIGNEFYDRTRLMDSMMTNVPKDANIRFISLQGNQTINQYQKRSESGNLQIISTISVNAITQIEFNDISKGFRKLDGTNEYIIRITEEFEK